MFWIIKVKVAKLGFLQGRRREITLMGQAFFCLNYIEHLGLKHLNGKPDVSKGFILGVSFLKELKTLEHQGIYMGNRLQGCFLTEGGCCEY